MKQVTLLAGTLFVIFFLASCVDSKNNKMIIGNWAGAEWLIDGKPSNYEVNSTGFQFDSTGNYSFDYGGTTEEGTYKVENDLLFTKPTGQNEIQVKIQKLTQDSLVFDMNRGGQAELLTLVRK